MNIRREDFEYLNLYAHFLLDESKGICAIILNGSMDTQGILKLQKKIKETLPIQKYDLVLDLTHVMYISSTGLGFLIYLQEYKRELCLLSHPPESILKTFKLLNLESMFTYYENVDDLKAFLKEKDHPVVARWTAEAAAVEEAAPAEAKEEGAMIPVASAATLPIMAGGFKIILKDAKIYAKKVIIRSMKDEKKS